MLAGEEITAADVRRVDPGYYEHRVAAVLRPGGVAATEALLCDELTFVGAPRRAAGAAEAVVVEGEELVKGGAGVRVTERNKARYCSLLVEHYLVGHCRAELALIVEGFFDIVPRRVLRAAGDSGDSGSGGGDGGDGDGGKVEEGDDDDDGGGEDEEEEVAAVQRQPLSALDLELIVAGLPGLDLADWRAHAEGALFDEGEGEGEGEGGRHAALRGWWWEVLEHDLDLEQQAKLLAYACGSSRLPAGGFGALRPKFNVTVSAEPTENLPSAHTCANQLQLPPYSSREQLRERLLKALELDAGFGFL